jgi:uncharacterized protein (TIGR02145 family)
MNKFYPVCFLFIFLLFSGRLSGQLVVTEGAAMNMTPLQLVESQIVGQGITVSNATYNGSSALISSSQIGYFTSSGFAAMQLGLTGGVLLTSGAAHIAIGPNNSTGASVNTNGPGDPDLTIIANVATHDKCVLEFDFVPLADTLKFRYVFGSEEFYEFCNSYNDAFGFFLSGPGITGTFSNNSEDIALMPGSSNYVTIYNLCADPTSNWVNPQGGLYYQYDGLTYVFTAWHLVTPCATYHIKLAVADAGDGNLDSGVFLEKNSFNATGLEITNSFQNPNLHLGAIEGCGDALVSFILAEPTINPYVVHYTIGGTATMGVDYTPIIDSVVIPAGSDSNSVAIHAYMDGIPEVTETVVLYINVPSCTGPTTFNDTVRIYDNSTMLMTTSPDTTSCEGISITLRAYPTGGQTPYTYIWSGGNTSQYYTLIPPTGFNSYTVISYDGCGQSDTGHINVNVVPTPHVTNSPLVKNICSGTSPNINLTADVPGATFTWTATGTAGMTGFSPGAGLTISDVLINAGFTTGIVTYHITPHVAGCTGPVSDFIVNVYPTPDLSNSPLTEQICNHDSTMLILTSNVIGTTFTWTCTPGSANISGYSDNAVPTNILNQTLHITVNTSQFVIYHITGSASGCNSPVTDFTVTVNPKPKVANNPMHDSICSGTTTNIHLTANCAGTTFTWTASLLSGNITGFSNGAGDFIGQTLVNTLPTVGLVEYTITPTAGFCTGNDTAYLVWVNPVPHLTTAPLLKSICSGSPTNIALTSDVAGALFTWTCTPGSANVTGFANNLLTPSALINQNLVNSGFTDETITYHITPHAYGCAGPVTDYVVTVHPVADVYFTPPSQSLCSGTLSNIQVLSHVAGSTFSWTVSASSLNVTGFSAGAGNQISQTLSNSGNTTETVTYAVTPAANGCVGISSNVMITVYPTPQVTTSPLSQTICTQNTATVNLTATVAGTTFTWTCTASSPNLSGFAPGNGNLISQVLANSGFTIETVTYHITPAANGCSGPVANYIVTVNPKPDVSNSPMSSQACSATSPNISLLSHVTGATFTWTATGSSPNITGFGPGSGLVINQVLTNSGLNNETVTYHITPSANGCSGLTVNYVVTVYPVPDVYFNPVAQTICSLQTTGIQILSHVAGSTFAWTASASSPNLSGFAAGSGNLISQALVNSGSTIETVTYSASPSANGCPAGPSQNVIVTVNPTPVITNVSTNFQQCNLLSTNIVFQYSVTGSTFTWTVTGSSPNVSGFTAGSGPSIIQTLQNSGFNIETVTYHVTPHANGCNGTIVNFVVTVFPVADVYFVPPAQTLCSGVTSNIGILSHVAGSAFTWTASGSSPNVTGYSAGSGNSIIQTLSNSGFSVETATYTVSPTANGCPGTSSNVIITIDPLPVVSLVSCFDPVTTTDAKPITLKGGTPSGGSYSGAGVNTGIFYPGIAGAGGHTLTYSYTNAFGCSNLSPLTIQVLPPPVFTCSNPVTDIRDNKVYATVQINTQCWMAADLDYGTTVTSSAMQRDNCQPEKYCFQDNPANCSASGGRYQWDEVMQYSTAPAAQGLCPPAWHIPTENEWTALFNFFNNNGFAGSPLKVSGYSGFNALLSGMRFENVTWNFSNFATLFWSSNAHGTNKAWAHGMNTYNPSVSYYPSLRANAFSVRCIKD